MHDQRNDYSDPPSSQSPRAPRQRLSLWDSICLIIGIIIGASIYETSPSIFRSSGGASMGMAAWALGGVVSLIGALCYAELASAYRTAGGDYTYLTRAYGPKVGFFFAWAELAVIRTGGSIAFMAYVFARYAVEFYNFGPQSKLIYALLGIIVLTFINAIGVRPGRVVQNVLTTANIVGLSSIAIIGLVWWLLPGKVAPAVQQTADNAPPSVELSFALTMVLVFYAYGGGDGGALLGAGAKKTQKKKRPAALLRTPPLTPSYLFAYLGAVGYDGVCKSKTIAADIFELPFGATGRKIISALIMFSSLGSIHGLLFTGMRLYGTFGRDHKLFAWLAGKQDPNHAHGALFAQAVFSIILITVVELAFHWRQALSEMAGMVGLQLNLDMQSETENIYKLVACTAPVFWFFFLLTGCSLFVLRWKEPAVERPFRVPLYPVLPFVFVASCAFMLYKSSAYALDQEPAEALIVAGLMFLGIPLGIMSG